MMVAAAPVSYTHLDVYKRQVIAVDNCHVGRNINAAVFMRSGKGELMVVLVDGAAHRDVYKRQWPT